MKRTQIVIKLQVQGLHRWEGCNIEEVAYLKNQHRHTFFIECHKEVSHNDRDIEIIQYKEEVLSYLKVCFGSDNSSHLNFEGLSCEMIADLLVKQFDLTYCSVLEDNENGAIVEQTK